MQVTALQQGQLIKGDRDIPRPGSGQVLVRNLACGPMTFTAVIFTGCLSACTRNTTFLDTYFVLGSLSKPIDPNRRQQLR